MNDIENDIFQNILTIVSDDGLAPATRNKLLHETLVTLCAEGLKDTRHGFGDLNAQTESLIRLLKIPQQEANALRRARRDGNRSTAIPPEALLHDAMALARLTSRVCHADIPEELTRVLPHGLTDRDEHLRVNSPDMRCIVQSVDEQEIRVIVDAEGEQGERRVRYREGLQYARMEYLHDILQTGMHLNLLGCQTDGDVITPRLIVVEPDCLMDISVIASCFEDYGHHPLMYLLSRMKEKANSQAILLGNFASACLDDIINSKEFSMARTLIRNFREKALDYAACTDFNGAQFKTDAARQMQNLEAIVAELRSTHDLSQAVLEPSFVCERLGLQGRVDLMTADMHLLVEQKSGRNIFLERHTTNGHGSRFVEKHYIQVLLYYGILYYNFRVSQPDIRLLYSKYPLPDGLLSVTSLMQLTYEALRFRNEAIALEFDIASRGLDHLLPQITEQTLNTAGMSDYFYNRYLRPQLLSLIEPLQALQPLERAYFSRMTQFVVRENIMSRVGVVEGTGSCVANLWNMPLAEKKETGNIYTALTIACKEKSSPTGEGGFDLITLSVPTQGEAFLPNFRRGDMVYLYAYPSDEEPDARRAMLFKGGLKDIRTDSITVLLADGQQNEQVFSPRQRRGVTTLWAVEHASSDVGGSASLRALYCLVTAPEARRRLLLGQREPIADTSLTLSQSYNPQLDELLLKAKQARDYFLLVGPPGTGKTSMALQYMVREALADHSEGTPSLLLTAYTNRAVDEICGMLTDNAIDFIRLGSPLSCADAFVPHLLENRVGDRPTLESMRRLLLGTQVIVATTSMIQSRSHLFSLKQFSLAIVDEASQILEPSIVGLLASHRGADGGGAECDIRKFILIGDYKQLPAVVQQSAADSAVDDPLLHGIGLDNCRNSLFERLIRQEQRAGRTAFMGTLCHQGRMHPAISAFPNTAFYFSSPLSPVPLPHQTEEQLGYTAPSEDSTDDLLKRHRLLFLSSRDCRQPEISDKVNADEARIVADLVRRLHRFYGPAFSAEKTVGIIVPYRNQIAMIRKQLEQLGIEGLEQISIDTVERYQGSQRDVIIYSFTIQSRYQLGFLTSNTFEEEGHLIDRKLNVALTRARRQLILTGNPRTLKANPLFRSLLQYISQQGGYVGA